MLGFPGAMHLAQRAQRGVGQLTRRALGLLAALTLASCSTAAAANQPTFYDRQLYKDPVTAGQVDISKLIPDCPPAKCSDDVWIQAVADFTGDGLPDILLTSDVLSPKGDELDRAGPIILMKNDGHGHFVRADFGGGKPYLLAKHPRAAAVADFNGDGKLDVMIVSNGFDRKPFPGETVRLLLQENGTLVDASANTPQIVSAYHGIAVGPFSGSGHTDAFIIAREGVHHVDPYFLVNDGTGHFTKSSLPDRFPPDSLKLWEPTADFPIYRTAKMADVDGDGHPDILLGTSAAYPPFKKYRLSNSRILFNDGSDHWDDKHVFEFPAGPWGNQTNTDDFAVADVNGDGLPDVVLTVDRETPGPSEGARLRLFLNQGNRTFKEAQDAFPWNQGQWDKESGLLPIHVFLRDINGDGSPDVIVSDISPIRKEKPTPYFVAVNDGHGHFAPLAPSSMGPAFLGSHLWPADVMGKGRPDLVGLRVFGEMVGKQYQSHGVEIVTYENIPNGGVKLTATHTIEVESSSEGSKWVDSHLTTAIRDAKPGEDRVDIHVQGNVLPNGDFANLQFVFDPVLGKKIPAALAKCGGPAPVVFGDGQYRAALGFQKAGNSWVAQDVACHVKQSPPLNAFMIHFVSTSFREIASDMVTSGTIDTIKSTVFRDWLKKVAAGDILISETVPAGAKIARISTTETGDYSQGNWVDGEFRTFIAGAKQGEDEADFHIRGNVSGDGGFANLQLAFSPPIGKQVPKALASCDGPPPVVFGDGQYRVLIGFQKAENGWVAVDAACHIKNSPPPDAFMIQFVITSFREIASDMVTSGSVNAMKNPIVQNWLKKVAAGEIVVR